MVTPFKLFPAYSHPDFQSFRKQSLNLYFSVGPNHFRFLFAKPDTNQILYIQNNNTTYNGLEDLFSLLNNLNTSELDIANPKQTKGLVYSKEGTIAPNVFINNNNDVKYWYSLVYNEDSLNEGVSLITRKCDYNDDIVIFKFPSKVLNSLSKSTQSFDLIHPFCLSPPESSKEEKGATIEIIPLTPYFYIRIWEESKLKLANCYNNSTPEEMSFFIASAIKTAVLGNNTKIIVTNIDNQLDTKTEKALQLLKQTYTTYPYPEHVKRGIGTLFPIALTADISKFLF